MFEHPLTLAKRCSPATPAVLKNLVAGKAVASMTLSRASNATSLAAPGLSVTSPVLSTYAFNAQEVDGVKSVLYQLAAEGGEPIELVRLNERVRHEDGVVDVGNSMPTWAPSTKPGVFWLALRLREHELRPVLLQDRRSVAEPGSRASAARAVQGLEELACA